MRASGETAEASCITNAAPATAKLPRCTRCQSLAKPSSLEYWHIGETTMRLRSVRLPIVSGENSSATGDPPRMMDARIAPEVFRQRAVRPIFDAQRGQRVGVELEFAQ